MGIKNGGVNYFLVLADEGNAAAFTTPANCHSERRFVARGISVSAAGKKT